MAPAASSGEAASKPAAASGLLEIKSPMVGTFYSASSPDADPFVKVGSRVAPDTAVCIIEAMKVFNEIQAGVAGVIREIAVENGARSNTVRSSTESIPTDKSIRTKRTRSSLIEAGAVHPTDRAVAQKSLRKALRRPDIGGGRYPQETRTSRPAHAAPASPADGGSIASCFNAS